MNAYELADDLEGWSDDVLSNKNRKNVFKKHAKMLRQQADRIAELEKDLKKYDQLAWDDLNKPKTIWCDCGDGITADSGAKCGVCASTTPQTKLCNGFCGEQECKDNQKNCERARMAKKLLGLGTPQTKPLHEFKGYEVVEQNDFDVTVRMPIDDWQHLMSDAPQTKPLSDEEIKEVIRKHWNRKYGNRDMLTLCKAVLEEANK